MKQRLKLAVLLALAQSSLLFAQTKDALIKDIDAYCHYISEKSKATNSILNSPDAIARFDNGDVYNQLQKVVMVGLSKNLADFSKAKFVRQLIHEECHYYELKQKAKIQIEYALTTVKNDALQFKLKQIELAKKKLSLLLATIEKRVQYQNDTIKNYYRTDSYLNKLNDTERQIRVDLASVYTPKAKPVQLNQLLKDLVAAQQKRQKTLNTLQKQDNWAFLVQAGAQQNLSARYNQTVQPYINVALRYNLGSTHSNHLLDSAENSFIAWQKEELLGLPKKLAGLVHSLTTLKAAEEDRLTYLTQSYRKYQSVSQRIGSIDSSEATHFKQELEIDRMLTHIEIQHVQHTISLIERAIT